MQLGAPAVGGNEIEILCLIQAGIKSLGYRVLPNSVDKFQQALNQCYYILLVIVCCTDFYLRRILRGLGTYLCLFFFSLKNFFFFFYFIKLYKNRSQFSKFFLLEKFFIVP